MINQSDFSRLLRLSGKHWKKKGKVDDPFLTDSEYCCRNLVARTHCSNMYTGAIETVIKAPMPCPIGEFTACINKNRKKKNIIEQKIIKRKYLCTLSTVFGEEQHGVVVRPFEWYCGGIRFESLSTHHCWSLSKSFISSLVVRSMTKNDAFGVEKQNKPEPHVR